MKKMNKKEKTVKTKEKDNEKKEVKFFSKENWKKDNVLKSFKKYGVLAFANFILAIVIVLFMDPLTIVSGGLSGIAIAINQLIPGGNWLDIIIYVGEGILMILSFIFLGKKVTFKSLFSAIVCPLFTTLFTRVIPLYELVNILYNYDPSTGVYLLGQDTALLLLGALISGIGVGIAVGLAFMVGGSTAGVDTIVLIIKKYRPRFKESSMCFVLDAGIILIGTIISLVSVDYFSSYSIVIIFINIMTAVLTAGTIEAIYMMRNSSVTINVISEHWEEIKNYLIYDLDRGCTIYDVYGGYAHAPRKEIKTVVSKKQSEKAKEEILNIDPNCFLSLTVSKGVFGEGFQSRFTDN